MRDLDSAVGRLDNIFMTLYIFVAALIIGEYPSLKNHSIFSLEFFNTRSRCTRQGGCFAHYRRWNLHSWFELAHR